MRESSPYLKYSMSIFNIYIKGQRAVRSEMQGSMTEPNYESLEICSFIHIQNNFSPLVQLMENDKQIRNWKEISAS